MFSPILLDVSQKTTDRQSVKYKLDNITVTMLPPPSKIDTNKTMRTKNKMEKLAGGKQGVKHCDCDMCNYVERDNPLTPFPSEISNIK